MKNINGVKFIQCDLNNKIHFSNFVNYVINKKIQVITSDMSPNMSGIANIDVYKSIELVKLAIKISMKILIPGGNFVVKILQGNGFKEILHKINNLFTKVTIFKPKASHVTSREIYIIAIGKKI